MFNVNVQVYGVRKFWRQLQRKGFDVARLMRRWAFKVSLETSPPKP